MLKGQVMFKDHLLPPVGTTSDQIMPHHPLSPVLGTAPRQATCRNLQLLQLGRCHSDLRVLGLRRTGALVASNGPTGIGGRGKFGVRRFESHLNVFSNADLGVLWPSSKGACGISEGACGISRVHPRLSGGGVSGGFERLPFPRRTTVTHVWAPPVVDHVSDGDVQAVVDDSAAEDDDNVETSQKRHGEGAGDDDNVETSQKRHGEGAGDDDLARKTGVEDVFEAPQKEAAEDDDVASKTGVEDGDGDSEVEPGFKMSRVCDRLIEVFWIDKPSPEEWRKLLAFSEEWARIRPHFFRRCEARARELQPTDPGRAADLFRLGRKLKEVDDSMCQHGELLDLIMGSEEELDGIVGRRRKDFTGEFFDYVRLRCEASYGDLTKQEEMVCLASKILVSVEQHDRMMRNEEAVEVAQTKFDDIMGSGSLDEACRKIDSLAERQQLDSTLMLMITKAWAAAKESNLMEEEAKDIMYHLYQQALANMRMLVPKEVRILRHILSLEDPREMFAALTAAFSPGDELEVQNAAEDLLCTTPDKLLGVIDQVLSAFYSNKESTLIEEAKKLMNPAVIKQMEILKQVIIDEFK